MDGKVGTAPTPKRGLATNELRQGFNLAYAVDTQIIPLFLTVAVTPLGRHKAKVIRPKTMLRNALLFWPVLARASAPLSVHEVNAYLGTDFTTGVFFQELTIRSDGKWYYELRARDQYDPLFIMVRGGKGLDALKVSALKTSGQVLFDAIQTHTTSFLRLNLQ